MPGSRPIVFWIQIVYLAALAVLALAYLDGGLPDWLNGLQTEELSIQHAILFFGALGGVLISLTGVFEHMYDWDDRYFFWHIARPLVGASVAVVAVLILQAGILAVGVQPSSPEPSNAGPQSVATGAKDLLYYVVAFVVGYREQSFRGMVKKAADLILTSPAEGSAPVVSSIEPVRGPVKGLNKVTISGAGLKGTEVVKFGPRKADFVVGSDGEITATVPGAEEACRVSVLLVTLFEGWEAHRADRAVRLSPGDPPTRLR
jgi:hypothetical protein